MLLDQPIGTTGEPRCLLRSASKKGPSPESLPLVDPPRQAGEAAAEGCSEFPGAAEQVGGSTSFTYYRPVIKYSVFVFVSLSLPLCVSLPEDLFLRMKSWVQFSSFFFFFLIFWKRSHPILKYLCLMRAFDCLRIWKSSLFFLSLEGQLLKIRLWPLQYELFLRKARLT